MLRITLPGLLMLGAVGNIPSLDKDGALEATWKTMEQSKARENYLGDEEYFMAVAFLSAQRSRDPNTQVGACIVNQENKIVGIGYNKMPNGCEGKMPWARDPKLPLSESKHGYVCHAELNAIMNNNGVDLRGCTMYAALFPCNECAKLIIQAGIRKVIYRSDIYHDRPAWEASRRMLKKAGVDFGTQLKPENVVIDFDSIKPPPQE